MIDKINELLAEVNEMKARNAEELEALRIKYLSKKGKIPELMNDFRLVPPEMKKEIGIRINELKDLAQKRMAELREQFAVADADHSDLDLTRTAYPVQLGTRHPLTIVKNEIIDIFSRLGFTLADGPEVEDDWHVFSSMNFAEDHPARDMQDTFFVESHPDIILRTHTSSVQSRVMEVQQPPPRRHLARVVHTGVGQMVGAHVIIVIHQRVEHGLRLGLAIDEIIGIAGIAMIIYSS